MVGTAIASDIAGLSLDSKLSSCSNLGPRFWATKQAARRCTYRPFPYFNGCGVGRNRAPFWSQLYKTPGGHIDSHTESHTESRTGRHTESRAERHTESRAESHTERYTLSRAESHAEIRTESRTDSYPHIEPQREPLREPERERERATQRATQKAMQRAAQSNTESRTERNTESHTESRRESRAEIRTKSRTESPGWFSKGPERPRMIQSLRTREIIGRTPFLSGTAQEGTGFRNFSLELLSRIARRGVRQGLLTGTAVRDCPQELLSGCFVCLKSLSSKPFQDSQSSHGRFTLQENPSRPAGQVSVSN